MWCFLFPSSLDNRKKMLTLKLFFIQASEYRENKIHTGWLDSRIAMRVRAERPPWYLSVVGGALYVSCTLLNLNFMVNYLMQFLYTVIYTVLIFSFIVIRKLGPPVLLFYQSMSVILKRVKFHPRYKILSELRYLFHIHICFKFFCFQLMRRS